MSARPSSPFRLIATQIYAFRRAGPLPANRAQGVPALLIATPVFFLLGAPVVFILAMPLLIKFSVSLQQVGVAGEPTIKLLPKVDE